ncbi:MAG: DUF3179 domain-containing protein [Lutibacter sp.]|uniref:DUF3179 domain-containing protein n=1 Tax=Lutibacter sp. TaxID=1925666 RepID=UPI00385E58F3
MKVKKFYVIIMVLFLIACGGNSTDSLDLNSSGSGGNTGNNTGDNSGSGSGTNSGGNNSDNSDSNATSQDWLIPISEVKDGGPGKDGIPSLDFPKFLSIGEFGADYLNDNELVVGIVKDNEARAYPHKILDWHEIVNDNLNEKFITINYCPLTGTAFGWRSNSRGENTTFGVSGLLYNTNLILYDRNTDSNWSQLKLKCVNGNQIGHEPVLESVVETNWGTWKKLYPNTKILSLKTGFSRNYDNYPYGDYKTNNDFFIFTASPSNNALPNKERIYAIIGDGVSKVYQFQKFTNGKVINELFNGKEYLVVGNENLIYSFELNESQLDLAFEYDFNNSEVFFKDNEGNKWSVFGKAIEGPRTGEQLKASKSVVSYWFAIAAFYPNPEIY